VTARADRDRVRADHTDVVVDVVAEGAGDHRREGPLSGRGVGALTMARTIRGGDLHVATGELGYHVLDTIVSIEESIDDHAFVDIASALSPIPALAADFDPFMPIR
jgi:hypothetical protein